MADVHSSTVKCCTKCGESKPAVDFVKRKSSRDGLSSHCKACKSADSRRWYEQNSEKKRATNKAWAEANRERMRPYYAAYYQANRERLDALNAAWARKNPAKRAEWALADYYKHKPKRLSAMRKWQERNADYVAMKSREWRQANPEAVRALRWNYKARKRAAPGHHTGKDISQLFASQRGRCACCGCCIRRGYHVDHIVALSKGGSNWPSNLQLLCKRCNLRKKDKDPFDFAMENGRLL